MSSDHDASVRDSVVDRASADLALDALADPVRREILAALAEDGAGSECSAGALADRIHTVGRTAVSTHLRVLRTAGLVTERRQGRYRYYAIDPSGAAADVIRLLHGLFRDSLWDSASAVVHPGARDLEAQAG